MIPWEARCFLELADLMQRHEFSISVEADTDDPDYEEDVHLALNQRYCSLFDDYNWGALTSGDIDYLISDGKLKMSDPERYFALSLYDEAKASRELQLWVEFGQIAKEYSINIYPFFEDGYYLNFGVNGRNCQVTNSWTMDSLNSFECKCRAETLIKAMHLRACGPR